MLDAQVRNAVSVVKRFWWVVRSLGNAEQMCVSSISHPHTSFCWIDGICVLDLWVFWSLKQGFRICSWEPKSIKYFYWKHPQTINLWQTVGAIKYIPCFWATHHLSGLTTSPLCDQNGCFQPSKKQQGNWHHHSPQRKWNSGQWTLRTSHLNE